jgi:hypothetical protein
VKENADLKAANADLKAAAKQTGGGTGSAAAVAEARAKQLAAEDKYDKLLLTSTLELKLAVAQAKMQCGGFMLSHFAAGGTSSASGTAVPPATQAHTPGGAPTPQVLQFGNFFNEVA